MESAAIAHPVLTIFNWTE